MLEHITWIALGTISLGDIAEARELSERHDEESLFTREKWNWIDKTGAIVGSLLSGDSDIGDAVGQSLYDIRHGISIKSRNERESDGYDENGYDADGYDANGYDEDGYDSDGYDENGYDADGYDSDGYDEDGYDSDGYDESGYDEDGFDRNGYDVHG